MANFLVLHTGNDAFAKRVTEILVARWGVDKVNFVSLWEMQMGRRWSQIQEDGRTENELVLMSGKCVNLEDVVVLNRISSVSAITFQGSSEEDRAYSLEETQALVLSWLAALPGRVVNPATHAGLAGPGYDQLAWMLMAHNAGLPTPDISLLSSQRRFNRGHLSRLQGELLGVQHGMYSEVLKGDQCDVFVVGGTVFGVHPISLREPIRKFAQLTGVDFLQVTLVRVEGDPDRWVFWMADVFPADVPDDALLGLVYWLESRAAKPVEVTA